LKPLANASVVKKFDFGGRGYAHRLTCALADLRTCGLADLRTCALADLRTCESIILMSSNIHNVDF